LSKHKNTMGVIKPDRASNTLIHNLSRSIFWKIESRKEKERVQGLARAPPLILPRLQNPIVAR